MAQSPDPLTKTAYIVDADKTPSSFFIRQWNLLLAFVKDTVGDISALIAAVAALAAQVAQILAVRITTTAPIAGGGPLLDLEPISHNNSGVAAGTYGDSTHVAQVTVDAKGHVDGVALVAITGGGSGAVSPFWTVQPTPPLSAGFTLLKGGSTVASITNVSRGVIFKMISPASSGVQRNMLAYQAVPGATWVARALIVPNMAQVANDGIGIAVRDNTTGRIHSFTLTIAAGPLAQAVGATWSAIDTFVGNNPASIPATGYVNCPFWVQLTLDTTNLIMSISLDGETFMQVVTVAKNTYVASIDQVGIMFNNLTSGASILSNEMSNLLMSWSVV